MIGLVFLGLRKGRGSIERLGRLWGCGWGGSEKTMIGLVAWCDNRKEECVCAREEVVILMCRLRKGVRTYGDERLPDFVRTGPMEGAPAPLSIGTFRRSRRDISASSYWAVFEWLEGEVGM
jgi:hypothetical protein